MTPPSYKNETKLQSATEAYHGSPLLQTKSKSLVVWERSNFSAIMVFPVASHKEWKSAFTPTLTQTESDSDKIINAYVLIML